MGHEFVTGLLSGTLLGWSTYALWSRWRWHAPVTEAHMRHIAQAMQRYEQMFSNHERRIAQLEKVDG